MGQAPPSRPAPAPRPLVVLDIDGTLLEAIGQDLAPDADYVLYRPTNHTRGTDAEMVCCSVGLPPNAPQEDATAVIRLWGRPGLPLFLDTLSQSADIAIWSMGLEPYVRLVSDRIVTPLLHGGQKPVAVLHRGHCAECQLAANELPRHPEDGDTAFPKHLSFIARMLGRPVDRIVLVEDTPGNAPTWQNVIEVPYFTATRPQSQQDRVLRNLLAAQQTGSGTGTGRKRTHSGDPVPAVRFSVAA